MKELEEEFEDVMNCPAFDNRPPEYDINRISRVYAMVELGDLIFPIIEEMWDKCVWAKTHCENMLKNPDEMHKLGALTRPLDIYYKFFSRIFDAFQEVGRKREEERQKSEEEFEKIKKFSEENADGFRQLINEFGKSFDKQSECKRPTR